MRSSVPTSHGFVPLSVDGNTINNPLPSSNKSEFVNQFEFVGALDNSPYLCIAECFKFIDSVCGGKERYAAYCREIVLEGGSVVAATLGTEVMKNEGNTFQKCFFSNVRLPLTLGNGPGSIKEHDRNRVTQWLTSTTVTEYNTFMAFIFHGGAWWVRLSGQVYLERRDFEWAGKILSEVCRRAQGGEYLNM
jgi:hercynylcysteine S-oxide lyase